MKVYSTIGLQAYINKPLSLKVLEEMPKFQLKFVTLLTFWLKLTVQNLSNLESSRFDNALLLNSLTFMGFFQLS